MRSKPGMDGKVPTKQARQTLKHDLLFAYWSAVGTQEQKLLNSMTNWQRHQWWKAGAKKRLRDLRKFAALERPPRSVGV